MTFDELFSGHEWIAIPGCPGRFVLRSDHPLTVSELLGDVETARQFRSGKARDVVAVVRLDQGGTISYLRADGTCLHTLNTEQGLKRKLEQLGISWF